jgi:hydrogenase expression/formation protein HypE
VLAAMRLVPEGRDAVIIGRVVAEHPAMAVLRTEIGGSRILDLPFSEQLPRIC